MSSMTTITGTNPNRKVEKTSMEDPSGSQHLLFSPYEGRTLPDGTIKWHKNSNTGIKTEEEAQSWMNSC